MGILFQNDDFTVGLSWLRRRTYVTDRREGRTVYPISGLINQMHACTVAMTETPMTDLERAVVGPYLMGRFAGSSLNPKSFGADMFLKGDPTTIVISALLAIRGEPSPTREPGPSPDLDLALFSTRHKLRGGFTLWVNGASGKAWAEVEGVPKLEPANASDVRKYFAVHGHILEDLRFTGRATSMIYELQYLLAKVIFNHHREGDFFREWPVEVIADRLYSYVQESDQRASDQSV